MAKGYWIARVDISDEARYREYVTANGVAFAKYGARFLVRAGPFECMEGQSRSRNVVIEFPSYAQALACWNSPEYAGARALRSGAAVADLVVIDGYDGPQPC